MAYQVRTATQHNNQRRQSTILEAWEHSTKVNLNTAACGRHAHAGIIAAHQGQAKSLITSTSTAAAAVADVDMLQHFFCFCDERCTPAMPFVRSRAALRFSKETRQSTPGSTCHPTISHPSRGTREAPPFLALFVVSNSRHDGHYAV